MTFRIYDKLCEDAKKLRTEVFVAEQGFETEFDDTDSKARHIVGYDGEKPVAVCRYFYDEEHKSYMIGRIAVIKECRGLHYGDKILSFAEQKIKQDGGKSVALSAQLRASGFYEKQGYKKHGDEYYDEYCPHALMTKVL